MYDNKIFSNNLTRLLEQHGMKKVDLCKICNVSKSSITNWCNGIKIPRMDKIEIIANYFGVQKSDLLEEKTPLTEEDEKREKYADILARKIMKLSPDNFQRALGYIDSLLSLQDL